MSDHLNEPVWDGNGGTLDPRTASDHDMLVALHVKMDKVVIPAIRELTDAQRAQERGDFTRAQERSIIGVVQDDSDRNLSRRSLKMPVFAVAIALASLIACIVLTLTVGGITG